MKTKICTLLLLFAALLAACQGSDNYKELPSPIARFVSQYWPNPDVTSFTQPDASIYEVIIKNGPTLRFNADYEWTSINGNGLPLLENLLFSCLPDKLYAYLSSGSMLNECFAIVRTPRTYTLTMLNTTVTYDIGSGTIRQS